MRSRDYQKNSLALPKPEVMPKPPKPLKGFALWFWKNVGYPLYDLGILTHVDTHAWMIACETYHRMKTAEKALGNDLVEVTKSGTKQNPLYVVVRQERECLLKILQEFGMTPVSRERITAKGKDVEDELEKLIGGKN